MRQPEEALELSAPLARRLAADHCMKDPATGETCAWSHGFWQYLRMMGLAVEPELHAGFFRASLEALLEAQPAPRLLISGAVDYALLAQVLAVLGTRGRQAEITVVDRCETPLELNRWYARRLGTAIQTRRSDILEFPAQQPYDAICTHAFLGYFDPAQREALFRRWHALLRPGGRIVTVHRLRPGEVERARFSGEQAQAYGARILQAAQAIHHSLDVEPAALAQMAQAYASRLVMWPVASLEQVRDLCDRAGFEVTHLQAVPLLPKSPRAVSAPTVPGGSDYLHLVATRR